MLRINAYPDRGLSCHILNERENGYMARTFNSLHQPSVMMSAGTGNPAGNNFTLFREKPTKSFLILIVDELNFILTKPADSFFNAYHLRLSFN